MITGSTNKTVVKAGCNSEAVLFRLFLSRKTDFLMLPPIKRQNSHLRTAKIIIEVPPLARWDDILPLTWVRWLPHGHRTCYVYRKSALPHGTGEGALLQFSDSTADTKVHQNRRGAKNAVQIAL